MAFEHYMEAGGRRMRMGYTTGTCAALAAKAAARLLLGGAVDGCVSLATPAGLCVEAQVLHPARGEGGASCAVQKDAGDDPDVTDGLLVFARVARAGGGEITIDGGAGVGRVTKPGLDQPVGAAAINRVPREMIRRAVAEVCAEHGYAGGLCVEISIPGGGELAKRTFNPRLGIEGGLSVLGTSGIVRPMSEEALLETIRVELNMHAAAGARRVLLVPGNYGEAFAGQTPALAAWPRAQCSNYIGRALDMAAPLGFEAVLLAGHAGKLVKLAGGIMDTHSKTADCRMELAALHAALAGADKDMLLRVLSAVSMEEAIDLLQAAGLWPQVQQSLLAAVQKHLEHRAGGAFCTGAVWFTNKHGLLGSTAKAEEILAGVSATL